MRPAFWQLDKINVELEDRDVLVRMVHGRTLVAVTVEFRLPAGQTDRSVADLKRQAECLARESLLDLASFLDRP